MALQSYTTFKPLPARFGQIWKSLWPPRPVKRVEESVQALPEVSLLGVSFSKIVVCAATYFWKAGLIFRTTTVRAHLLFHQLPVIVTMAALSSSQRAIYQEFAEPGVSILGT